MDEKIINSILKKINNNEDISDEYVAFSDKRYNSIKLDKNNFKKTNKIKTNKKIAFVDGGNTEIMKLANLSLQLVRVYYNIFDKKKIDSKRFDFYVLVEAVEENGISYSVEIAPNHFLDKLSFDSFDETIREGKHRVKISRIGDVIRRFLELKLATLMISKLNQGDIVILDGSLEASITDEAKYLDELYSRALENNVIVAGLSKSCTFLTNKGNSAVSVLKMMAPSESWYYYPIAEIDSSEHQADMFFVKLNSNSKYIFRFEVFKKNKYEIDEILSLLMDNSKDPVFLGYPYGLIEADKFARVSNNEKEYLKTTLMVKLKREDIERDAHKILDGVG